MAQRSSGIIPSSPANNDDSAALLTTTYTLPVGVSTASTVQLDVVATLAADTDQVIIQLDKNGTTKNIILGWNDFRGNTFNFVAGDYRAIAYFRGFGVDGVRIGLSSTATVISATCSAVG